MSSEHPVTPAEAWEFRYAEQSQRWSGHPNATLVDLVGGLPVNGRALDLGCGEGADAIWLARQGWNVTGVDISPTAVARAQGTATEVGIALDQLRFEAHDLSAWSPTAPTTWSRHPSSTPTKSCRAPTSCAAPPLRSRPADTSRSSPTPPRPPGRSITTTTTSFWMPTARSPHSGSATTGWSSSRNIAAAR